MVSPWALHGHRLLAVCLLAANSQELRCIQRVPAFPSGASQEVPSTREIPLDVRYPGLVRVLAFMMLEEGRPRVLLR